MNGLINQRRVLATLLLLAAIALLILGETLLKHRLGPVATLVYWTGCLLATLGAILFACLDLSRSMRESRAEQRSMIEQTVHEIESERERREAVQPKQPRESR